MNPEQRLKDLGIELPPAPAPVASYVPYVCVGDLVFVSGQLPIKDGKLTATGKVGRELSVEAGAAAAKTAGVNTLAQLSSAAAGLQNVARIVRVGVFVNSADGFTGQPQVANGVSDLLVAAFGDAGRHARAAVGVNELPLDAPVEVELIAQLKVRR